MCSVFFVDLRFLLLFVGYASNPSSVLVEVAQQLNLSLLLVVPFSGNRHGSFATKGYKT